jgi:hypothetical protein
MPPEYEALCDEWRNTFVALRDKVAAAILKGRQPEMGVKVREWKHGEGKIF